LAHKIAKFLRLFFGCHAKPERSFHFGGKQFPICARCTGELVGMITGIPITVIWGYPSFIFVLLMMFPLILDGFLQKLTTYESNNFLRLITGILFGIAFIFVFIYFHRSCVWIASMILKLFGVEPSTVDRVMERFML